MQKNQRICEDCRDDDFHEGEHRNAADLPTIPNGHVIKGNSASNPKYKVDKRQIFLIQGGTSGNGYTRLPQSEDGAASVKLILHHDGEDED